MAGRRAGQHRTHTAACAPTVLVCLQWVRPRASGLIACCMSPGHQAHSSLSLASPVAPRDGFLTTFGRVSDRFLTAAQPTHEHSLTALPEHRRFTPTRAGGRCAAGARRMSISSGSVLPSALPSAWRLPGVSLLPSHSCRANGERMTTHYQKCPHRYPISPPYLTQDASGNLVTHFTSWAHCCIMLERHACLLPPLGRLLSGAPCIQSDLSNDHDRGLAWVWGLCQMTAMSPGPGERASSLAVRSRGSARHPRDRRVRLHCCWTLPETP